MPFLIGLIIILVVLVIANIRIVPQANAFIIERFGGYSATWQVGLHVKIPFVERVAKKGEFKRTGCGLPSPARYYKG